MAAHARRCHSSSVNKAASGAVIRAHGRPASAFTAAIETRIDGLRIDPTSTSVASSLASSASLAMTASLVGSVHAGSASVALASRYADAIAGVGAAAVAADAAVAVAAIETVASARGVAIGAAAVATTAVFGMGNVRRGGVDA